MESSCKFSLIFLLTAFSLSGISSAAIDKPLYPVIVPSSAIAMQAGPPDVRIYDSNTYTPHDYVDMYLNSVQGFSGPNGNGYNISFIVTTTHSVLIEPGNPSTWGTSIKMYIVRFSNWPFSQTPQMNSTLAQSLSIKVHKVLDTVSSQDPQPVVYVSASYIPHIPPASSGTAKS